MQLPDSWPKYGFFVLLVVLVLGAIIGAVTKHKYENQLVKLQNEVASKDQTLEVQKGVYTKLALQEEDLKTLINSKDQQVKDLLNQIKKGSQDLLTANQLVVSWKNAYQGVANSTQSVAPSKSPGGVARRRVDFNKDFGVIGVNGYTLTDPPESWLKVEQLRPLKLTVVVSQDSDRVWHSYATSNDDNSYVNIDLAGVNPYILTPRWYEKIQLDTMLASGGTSLGVLGGVGLSYQIKQFDVGPAVFGTISGRGADAYFGAVIGWRPFQR